MTITHIVSFKYASDVTPKQRVVCFSRFLSLKAECKRPGPNDEPEPVPYILSLVGGQENISPEGAGKGFDHTFVATFSNKDDLTYYLTQDPVHLAFGDFARSLTSSLQGGDAFIYDFETTEAGDLE